MHYLSSILADVSVGSGDGMVHQLFAVLIIGICVALIWWVGRYFITSMSAPPAAMKIWTAIFILVGLIVALNFLMGLGGHSFVKW